MRDALYIYTFRHLPPLSAVDCRKGTGSISLCEGCPKGGVVVSIPQNQNPKPNLTQAKACGYNTNTKTEKTKTLEPKTLKPNYRTEPVAAR